MIPPLVCVLLMSKRFLTNLYPQHEIPISQISAVHKRRSLFGNTISNIESGFQAFDRSGKGCISLEDFQTALYRLDLGLSLVQSRALFDVIDSNHDGTINWTEFVQALQFRRKSIAQDNEGGDQKSSHERANSSSSRDPGQLVAAQIARKAKQNNWRALDVFRLMDKNASGRATIGEIAQGLAILGIKNSTLEDAKYFKAFVSPNSEAIEFNELSRALKKIVRGNSRLGGRGK